MQNSSRCRCRERQHNNELIPAFTDKSAFHSLIYRRAGQRTSSVGPAYRRSRPCQPHPFLMPEALHLENFRATIGADYRFRESQSNSKQISSRVGNKFDLSSFSSAGFEKISIAALVNIQNCPMHPDVCKAIPIKLSSKI